MSEWSEAEYGGSTKNYFNGLATGSVSWSTSREDKGYIARIGRITLKKRFPYMKEGQDALDRLVLKRVKEYLEENDGN